MAVYFHDKKTPFWQQAAVNLIGGLITDAIKNGYEKQKEIRKRQYEEQQNTNYNNLINDVANNPDFDGHLPHSSAYQSKLLELMASNPDYGKLNSQTAMGYLNPFTQSRSDLRNERMKQTAAEGILGAQDYKAMLLNAIGGNIQGFIPDASLSALSNLYGHDNPSWKDLADNDYRNRALDQGMYQFIYPSGNVSYQVDENARQFDAKLNNPVPIQGVDENGNLVLINPVTGVVKPITTAEGGIVKPKPTTQKTTNSNILNDADKINVNMLKKNLETLRKTQENLKSRFMWYQDVPNDPAYQKILDEINNNDAQIADIEQQINTILKGGSQQNSLPKVSNVNPIQPKQRTPVSKDNPQLTPSTQSVLQDNQPSLTPSSADIIPQYSQQAQQRTGNQFRELVLPDEFIYNQQRDGDIQGNKLMTANYLITWIQNEMRKNPKATPEGLLKYLLDNGFRLKQ